MGQSDFMQNTIQDVLLRGQSATIATKVLSWNSTPTYYVGLIGGSTFPNSGAWLPSTAYTSGQYCWPATPNGRLYKCTTSGTSNSSAPTWPTTAGATVSDGGAVWTEQTAALEALTGATMPEPSGNAYARQAWTCSLATIMGTTLTASASASSGISGTVANLAAITFPQATPAAWGPIWGIFIADASTNGNHLHNYPLQTPKVVSASDQMTFGAGTANTTYGSIQITAG